MLVKSKNMLRILYDDFDQKVKNIHDEMDLHHSYIKKACIPSTMITEYLLLNVRKHINCRKYG